MTTTRTTSRPTLGDGETDPGCQRCGTCIDHDGCADDDNPHAEADCHQCGACADCIAVCATQHPVRT